MSKIKLTKRGVEMRKVKDPSSIDREVRKFREKVVKETFPHYL